MDPAADEPYLQGGEVVAADESEGDVDDLDETLAETCPPSEQPASTTAVASGSGGDAKLGNSSDPIRLTTGEKVESAVDLVIPLTGKDFRLVRNYRSYGPTTDGDDGPTVYHGNTGGSVVGNHWNLPIAMWVDESLLVLNEPAVRLHTTSGPKTVRITDENTTDLRVWGAWRGQRTQRFLAARSPAITLDGEEPLGGPMLPVWRLIQPGQYTLEFWRSELYGNESASNLHMPQAHQAGRLLRRIDAYGNIWQFLYSDFYDQVGNPVDSRPVGIRFLRAPVDANSTHSPMAELHFFWDDRLDYEVEGYSWPVMNPNYGRLREARVLRFRETVNGSVPDVVTQRVLYTYHHDVFGPDGLATPQVYGEGLGSNGDLIQVTKLTRVDGSSPSAEQWRTQITQYRYHNGNHADSPLPDLYGHRHALKAVIYPQQVERYAFENSSGSTMKYIGDAARELLAMDDFDGDDYKALAWAGKIITKYDPVLDDLDEIDYDQPFRVREQVLAAGCGCSGSASVRTRLTYDYFDNRGVVTPVNETNVWSAHITEWHFDSQSWVAHSKTLHDFVQEDDANERLRLQNMVLAAPINPLDGSLLSSGQQYWVTRYEYDRRRPMYGSIAMPRDAMKAILYPSAMASYTPAAVGVVPTYTAHSDKGFVVAFNHNEDGRLTAEYVREGWAPIRNNEHYASDLNTHYTIVRQIHRPAVEQAYLKGFSESVIESFPIREWSYRQGTASYEETRFGYAFGAAPYGVGARLIAQALILPPVDAEENGPGASSGAATRTIVIFDEAGEVKFAIDANDSLTVYGRQASTGRVSSIVANATVPGDFPQVLVFNADPFHSPNFQASSFTGRNSDGGSLTTAIDRDALGRITTVTAPGGVQSSIVRSFEVWEHTALENPKAYRYYTETVLPHAFESQLSGFEFSGTASRTWFTANGTALGSESYILDPASATSDREAFRFSYAFANGGKPVTRSASERTVFDLVTRTVLWPDLEAFDGPVGSDPQIHPAVAPRVSSYEYDIHGNLVRTVSPDGSIQAVDYDEVNRPVAISLGTDASSGSGNMVLVREMWYDSDGAPSSGVGDGHLTLVREHSSGTDVRETELRHDFRGRLVLVRNPLSPHAFFEYDNLDRSTYAVLFDESSPFPTGLAAPPSSTRLSAIRFHYDSQGKPYRRSVLLDPTDSESDTLDEFMWYDLAGQTVAMQSPSAPKMKMQYDGLGRLIRSYVTADPGEANPTTPGSFADTYDRLNYAPNLSGDIVLEQTEYDFITGGIGAGRLSLVTSRSRLHGAPASATGALGS
ncbi:MAG: DUF6531 domain-containing protein, partial [Phycisphaerales bacterium]